MATSSITAHIVMSNSKGANALVYALARERNPEFDRDDSRATMMSAAASRRLLDRIFLGKPGRNSKERSR